jgi:hypothetical protein
MRKVTFIPKALVLLGVLLNASCKKETTEVILLTAPADSSYLSVTNASPSISNLLLYVGNERITIPDSPLSYGATTFASYTYSGDAINPVTDTLPYLRIPSGYQQVSFTSPSSTHNFISFSNYFSPGHYYSVFVTDTATHGQVPYVLLEDKIGVTDTSQAQVRFLNLSPDSPPVDIWAFPDVGPNGFKLFSNCAYLPTDYSAVVSADTFSLIKPDPYYFVATQAGTYNVLLNGGLIIRGKTITTIYSLGYLGGNGPNLINVNVIQYNQ